MQSADTAYEPVEKLLRAFVITRRDGHEKGIGCLLERRFVNGAIACYVAIRCGFVACYGQSSPLIHHPCRP
jgi:hypothetical protein